MESPIREGSSIAQIPSQESLPVRSIARGSIWLLGSQAFGALTVLIYVPLLARYLGAGNYGQYSYAYAFIGLFEMLSVFGLHQIVERESARDKANAGRYLGDALWIKLFLTLGTFTLIASLNFIVNDRNIWVVVLLAATESLIRKYSAINRNVSRAFGRMEYEFLIVTLDRLVAFVGVLFAIRADLGLIAIFAAFLLASIVQAIVSAVLVWGKLVTPLPPHEPNFNKHLWKESLPIGLSLQGGQFYQRQGTTLLEWGRGVQAVGLFSVGFRMYQFTRIVADSVVGALFPVFSRFANSSQRNLATSFNMATKYLLVAALAIAIGCWALAPQFIAILFGSEYESSAEVLRWLSLAVVFTFMNVLYGSFLQATNKQRLGTIIMVIALAINLGLNALLIPKYGIMGAVWAWIFSEGLFCCLGAYFAIQQVTAVTWLRSVMIPLVGGLIAALVLLLMQGASALVSVLIAEFLFFAIVLGLDRLLSARRVRLSQKEAM